MIVMALSAMMALFFAERFSRCRAAMPDHGLPIPRRTPFMAFFHAIMLNACKSVLSSGFR